MVAVHNNVNEIEMDFSTNTVKLPLTVRARTSQQALNEVTEKLGEDAVILATRTVTDPITDMRMVEVEATIVGDTNNDNVPSTAASTQRVSQAVARKKNSSLFKIPGQQEREIVEAPVPEKSTEALLEILREVRSLKSEVVDQKSQSQAALDEVQTLRRELREVEIAVANLTSEHAVIRENGVPGEWVTSYRRLIASSIDASIAEEIIDSAVEFEESRKDLEEDFEKQDLLIEAITARIKIKPILSEAVPPPVVSVTGPAGAGKTTMLAKIAAHAVLKGNSTVGIIACENANSFDTLAKVAGALGTPILCASKDDGGLSRAVFTMQQEGVDLILIDTPPVRLSNKEANQALWRELRSVTGSEILAVLPATMRDIDLARTCKAMSRLGFHRLAFTQMDETLRSGSVLTAISSTGLPLAALSYGTSITEDFVLPEAETLAQRMIQPNRSNSHIG